ncbi:MAG: sulfatase-like hydrolase/transferase, partial [Verrucomicrobiota bacterium]
MKSALLNLVLLTIVSSGFAYERPNTVVIMADDLGYGDLSPYRKGAPRTPATQRLADEGMLFTDAHSPSAVCTPTRYSLLTGRYAWRSYLQDWVLNERMPLLIEEGTETLPAMMQTAGYVTGCVGKWHLGFGRDMDAYQNNDFTIGPNTVGFDYFFGVPFSHNSSPEMEVFMENDRI